MNVNVYIKCNVCGCVTRVKVQAGWLREHPIAIYCGECNILIEGTVFQDPDKGKIAMQFKNATNLSYIEKSDYFVESSGEFITMKMVSEDDPSAKLSSIMPPFIRNVYDDKNEIYKRNFMALLKMKEDEWRTIRRVFELWSNHSNELYLKQELKRNLIKHQEGDSLWQEKGLHILYNRIGKFMKYDEKRSDAIVTSMKKLPYGEVKNLLEFLSLKEYLVNCKRRIYEVTNQYIDKFQYMMPAYKELLKEIEVNYNDFGITTTSFEILKDFYISCYELLGDMVPILNGLNNILLRKRYNESTDAKIKYEDLLYKPNSLKVKKYIPEEGFSKLVSIKFNERMRNAIGHYDYKIEGKSQKILYTRNTNHTEHKEYEDEIYLLEFTIDCLKLYQSVVYMEEIIYLLETADYSGSGEKISYLKKKIYPNDPCPCGSGMKYKKCCDKLIDKYCNYIEVMGGIDNAI